MEYKYQLHIHTAACSLCGKLTPEDLCQALLDNGYQGAVITNHFLHGNTALDRTLPWEDFVRAYEEDYLACKRYGDIEVICPVILFIIDDFPTFLLPKNPIAKRMPFGAFSIINLFSYPGTSSGTGVK